MKISDQTLLAYVDNELDLTTRAEVEAAIAADPELARRVEQQRSLRKLLGAAYDPARREPVAAAPQPAAQIAPAGARVLKLATARKARTPEAAASGGRGWMAAWGGMAACLMLGLFAGRSGWLVLPGEDIATQGGKVVARGSLARALSTQVASAQPPDPAVKIGVSFLSRGGEFCRSFVLAGTPVAGLACRHGNDWELRVLAQEAAAASAATIPPAVLRAVDEQMQGSPLDAAGERAAMSRGWRP